MSGYWKSLKMLNPDQSKDAKNLIDKSFAAHEREQILFNLKNTTPLQRLEWLEETLELLSPYLKSKPFVWFF